MYDKIFMKVIDVERIIFHIDVNNAFLSWTAIDLLNKGYKYDIRKSYAVIGGDETKRRGVVLAKSSSAKKLGIKTGETLIEARKKCKVLKIYPPNYNWYQQKSKELFKLLRKYTPDIEIASIDECYLDYGKVKHLYGNEIEFAKKLKDEIYEKLKFTVNIGIANNKLCAKMASDFEKPNKIHTLYHYEIQTKMFPLPINDLFGIGKKTTEKLKKLNILKISDLASADVNYLYKYFKNQAIKMIEIANGIDNSPVISEKLLNKDISNSTTLDHDILDKLEAYKVIENLVINVSHSLRCQNQYAYVVGVILKDNYFKTYSHQKKLKNATNLTNEIYNISKDLFDEMWKLEPIRLIGVRLSNLVSSSNHQVSLFDDLDNRELDLKLENTIDNLKAKYGYKIINNASLDFIVQSKKE